MSNLSKLGSVACNDRKNTEKWLRNFSPNKMEERDILET